MQNKFSLFFGLGVFSISFPFFTQAASLGDYPVYLGETASEYSGHNVSGAGDVNGDGYDDLIIGAYNKSDAGSGAGAAYLVYGNASDPTSAVNLGDTTNAVEFSGQAVGDYAGFSVAGGGDVNGDGYDDLLVGAYGYDNGSQTDAGRVYLIYGSATTLTSQTLGSSEQVVFTAVNLNSNLGRSVAFAGDINADGYDDIVVGASGYFVNSGNDGAAFVIYGSASTLTSKIITDSSIIQLSGEEGASYAGWSVNSAGDVNGDSYDDFLVGAYGYVGSVGPSSGAAYLVYGRTAILTSSSLSTHIRLAGETGGIRAGLSVNGAGDINGDGYDDFLIGAPRSSAGASNAGAIYLIYGSSTELTSLTMTSTNTVRLVSNIAEENLGASVASMGDVNEDGYDDFFVGAPSNSTVATNAGMIYLLLGSTTEYTSTDSALLSDSVVSISGVGEEHYAGQVAAAGDRNNDGMVDIIIGAYGLTSTATEQGGTYLITPFIDADGDGESAPGSLVGGTDTDDTIVNNGIEISGNSIDDDDDGIIDEVNTLSENGVHPGYGLTDPTDKAAFLVYVESITPKKRGRIWVKYADDSIYRYNIYPNFSGDKKVVVKSFRNRGLVNVLQPKGTMIRLINIYNGDKLSAKVLSQNKTYVQHSVKNLDVRNDGSVEVVVTSKKKSSVRVSVLKVDMTTLLLALRDTVPVTVEGVVPSRTINKKKKILLKNSAGEIVLTFFVTKGYILQQL